MYMYPSLKPTGAAAAAPAEAAPTPAPAPAPLVLPSADIVTGDTVFSPTKHGTPLV